MLAVGIAPQKSGSDSLLTLHGPTARRQLDISSQESGSVRLLTLWEPSACQPLVAPQKSGSVRLLALRINSTAAIGYRPSGVQPFPALHSPGTIVVTPLRSPVLSVSSLFGLTARRQLIIAPQESGSFRLLGTIGRHVCR